MKNFVFGLFVIIVLAGCGGQAKKEEAFQGKVEQNDYLNMGYDYLKKADIVKAVQSFDMAIKKNPQDVKNYMVLGEVYLRLKNYGSAEDTFIGATRVAPNNPDTFYYLALSRAPQADKKDLAVEAAKKSIELYMQNKDEESFKKALILLRGLEQDQIQAP